MNPASRTPSLIFHLQKHCTPSVLIFSATSLSRFHSVPASKLRLRRRPVRDWPLKDDAGHIVIVKMADEKDTLQLGGDISWDIPEAPWTTARPSKRDPARFLPQAIAHRGYKASWPENTMGAFKGAVEVGAHAIETDVHLSRDGVAVLSHDATLTRCFGIDKKLADCDWEYLSTVETLREPKQGLPRLQDLLEWLVEADKLQGDEHSHRPWVLLDIKLDDDAQDLVNAISSAIAQVPASRPWQGRIVLGCWNASVLKASRRTLPDYPVAHIGFSLSYARHFLPIPNVGFNMAFHTLVRPYQGRRFMRDVRAARRPLYAWTVNHPRWMRWCIERNVRGGGGSVVDGVVTDDPGLYLDVCRRYEDDVDAGVLGRDDSSSVGQTVALAVDIVKRHVLAKLFFWYRRHVQGKLDDLDGKTKRQIKRD
ncbi:Transcriptional activator protein acu-15, partial [Metarhizium hybridum]